MPKIASRLTYLCHPFVILLTMKYSIIIAVFNRPDELRELLESLAVQTFRNVEVVVVEDGSSMPSNHVCDEFRSKLDVQYYFKENTGPGLSRNYGCRRATGDFLIFLDSDCTVPPDYLEIVAAAVAEGNVDAFGGPDREHAEFSSVQKAISYAMTSFFTTGGIRGSKVRVGGKFHPRSFNMGISRKVFNATDGFSRMRFGEDIDLSIRMIEEDFNVALFTNAWVYHKRRSNFKKFFKQVYNSGLARINLSLRHPGTLKLTHFFPVALTTYLGIALCYALVDPFGWTSLMPLALYSLVLAVDAGLRFGSISLAVLSVLASWVQLIGYGLGFFHGFILRVILNKPEQGAFENTLYS